MAASCQCSKLSKAARLGSGVSSASACARNCLSISIRPVLPLPPQPAINPIKVHRASRGSASDAQTWLTASNSAVSPIQ